ncbi:hypothetical protein BDBG_17552 [Blastomyces gilchristii SLH14081]|uniref:Uncharacterized protein n=1 Tax=Blastomyces gilchristii (strain SLH14081) TaxID=559298 RepID=A0A179UWT9_BLAGS|nr:uncharacterized protein BDBG_17552 [Blastomyces gilchristii SLH14081]OAT11689.1 hypothetical protein BDBG_17552 [Blastomyces gilchristii SLH14081]
MDTVAGNVQKRHAKFPSQILRSLTSVAYLPFCANPFDTGTMDTGTMASRALQNSLKDLKT